MADKGYTKVKLLYILDFLLKNSDEEHPVTVDEISDMLKEKGIECERKSIYSDVQNLTKYGIDIISVRTPKRGYAVCSRDFELPEVRLLIDAVQSADFITAKKTKELIKKIETLCSTNQATALSKQVYIEKRHKCSNEEIYYNIDVIHRAIQSGKQIRFIYVKRKLDEETSQVISEEKEFCISPYAMIWSNDHYYTVGNNPKYDNLMHTRIDRMKKVEIDDTKARSFSEVSPYEKYFDSADYSGKTFNMFSGETQTLEISCHNSILEEMLDRFGSDSQIRAQKDSDRFTLVSKCVESEGLVSWIMQFGNKIKVIAPKTLKQQVSQRAREIMSVYEQ